MPGTLYLCATPIGNLEDITYRCIRILKEADIIGAEDTRNSIKLLNHFDIHTPMTSYHEFNKVDKARYLVEEMLKGKNVAIITDAGTPGISDPGEEIARQAIEAGIRVESVPGATAFVTALTMSGLPTRRFAFEAFLPRDKEERGRILDNLKDETRTIILYEAPHRLVKTLETLKDTLGNRKASLCRELTKKHEEAMYGTLEEFIAKYETEDPRGEYVIVIEGKSFDDIRKEEIMRWEELSIPEHLDMYIDQGMDKKTAMKKVAADRGISKREVYAATLEEK